MGENAVGRRLERLLGVGPHGQAHIQPRPRVPTERPPNPQPLPEPLRADEKGLDGKEHQTLRKGTGEGRPARPAFCADDVHVAGGLLALRGRVSKAPEHDLDHEANVQSARDRYLYSEQT